MVDEMSVGRVVDTSHPSERTPRHMKFRTPAAVTGRFGRVGRFYPAGLLARRVAWVDKCEERYRLTLFG